MFQPGSLKALEAAGKREDTNIMYAAPSSEDPDYRVVIVTRKIAHSGGRQKINEKSETVWRGPDEAASLKAFEEAVKVWSGE